MPVCLTASPGALSFIVGRAAGHCLLKHQDKKVRPDFDADRSSCDVNQ
jgi:hypothetical protein